MADLKLFRTAQGHWVTQGELLDRLKEVRADECEFLFIHSEMSFGAPNPELKKKELLGAVVETIRELGVPTCGVPTFTFSFCNGEEYNVQKSRSKMGVLNEYVRRLPEAKRSADPLMSVALMGREMNLIDALSRHSIGEDSFFDRVHRHCGARFLFLGVNFYKCFTYLHYVEERERVPYRYDRDFTGNITDGDRTYEDTYKLFVRYQGVEPGSSDKFEKLMLERGDLLRVPCGDNFVTTIEEPVAYQAICDRLDKDIDYFLEAPYPRDKQEKTFRAENMVAL